MRRRMAIVATAALVGLLPAGCSATGDDADTPDAATAAGDESGGAGSGSEDRAAASGGSSAEGVTVEGAARPMVTWPSVDGAATYRLTVTPDEGQPWAWEGEDTSVVLGGGSSPDGDGIGFRLTSGAVITVTAHDPAGAVLRLDQVRTDAPRG